ncbi:MAG: PQQ-binding-like beta-propeller repeat protein [Bryobacterales bacterium]|nr:PQQ-binding-like beta-propeller repeat protein [Bryobacterales bacterium]
MRRRTFLWTPFAVRAATAAATVHWPMFRGPSASGVAEGDVPMEWNADESAGKISRIRWKTPIPGLGHSSPVIWDERLLVATAVRTRGESPLRLGLYGDGDSANDSAEQSWKVYCLDKNSGKILWERTAHKGLPKVQRHTKATHANTTLATNGEIVAAFFGSEGLYCYSLKGDLLWSRDLGILDMGPEPELQWGFASSPVLASGRIVLQADCKKDPFLAVLRTKDGTEVWRTPRTGTSERSWSTPSVVRAGQRTQIVTNGWPWIASYDFESGEELWRLRSEGDIPVPAPVTAHGLIYVTNAHGGKAPLYAIRPEAAGDITPRGGERSTAHIAWSVERNGAYMQTPLIYGDLLYSCSDRGILKCYRAKTGEKLYEQRLGVGTSGYSSSPVAAGNKLYFASEEGDVFVVEHGESFRQVAKNAMGETVMATPAISNNRLYYRTRGHVAAIGD